MSDIALITLPDPIKAFAANGCDPIIKQIRDEVAGMKLDISTEKGRKEIASVAYKIAKTKTQLDDLGKDLTADLKKQTGAVDAERKRMREALDALKEEVRKPLTEWEEREEKRTGEHEDSIAFIEGLTMLPAGAGSELIQGRLDQLKARRNRDWQEFDERAGATADLTEQELVKQLDAAKQREAEKVELERLRAAEQERLQRERDERIAKEAREAAERQAAEAAAAEERRRNEEAKAERKRTEQAFAEEQERGRKAEEGRLAAEAEVAASQERERAAAEEATRKERERQEAENKRIADEAAARAADAAHRDTVLREAMQDIVDKLMTISPDDALRLVEFIAAGEVRHLIISF